MDVQTEKQRTGHKHENYHLKNNIINAIIKRYKKKSLNVQRGTSNKSEEKVEQRWKHKLQHAKLHKLFVIYTFSFILQIIWMLQIYFMPQSQ